MSWLVTSVVLSVALTAFLNVGLRMFRSNDRGATPPVNDHDWLAVDPARTSDRRVRVWAPWKAMLVGSLVLTILVNLVLWIV